MDRDISLRRLAVIAVVIVVVGLGAYAIATNHMVPSEGEVPVRTNDGPQINVSGTGDVDYETTFGGNNTIELQSEFGNATFYSPGRTYATVGLDVTGWTDLSEINTTANHLSVTPEDKRRLNISGGLDTVSYRPINVSDNSAELSYSTRSQGSLKLHGISVDEVGLINSAGDPVSWETVAADNTLSYTVDDSQTDAYLVEQSDPVLSNPDPTGRISRQPDKLQITVSDDEFALYNEEVEVNISHNGELISSQTITSSQTVEATLDTIPAGVNNWSVKATDSSGATATQSYSYETPSELTIYNETNPTSKIDTAEVEIQFFEAENEGDVFERSTTDGTINMTGLPIEKSFVALAQADGYVNRRIFIGSLFEQESIYLLPESEDYVETVFDLEDFSGQFQSEDTVLELRRPLDGSWKTVEGDKFGATGEFATNLLRDARHELRVTNIETNQTRQLGSFRPTTAGVHTVRINPDLSFGLETPVTAVSYDPGIERLAARTANITIGVDAIDENLSSYQMQILYENGSSSRVLADYMGSEPLGEDHKFSIDLTDLEGGTVTAVAIVETVDGQTQIVEKEYHVDEYRPNEYSAVSWFEKFGNLLGDGVTIMLSIFITVALTAVSSSYLPASTELIGVIPLMSIALFALVGWVPMSLLFAGAATWAGFAGLKVIR